REGRQLERSERVAHDGQLGRLGDAEGLLGEAGLWTMWKSGRVQRDRADGDALSRSEVAGDVVDHLLGLEIRVVVRDRHRLRVEVELPRAERADHEVVALEGLVRRRGLVDPARDGLEVVDR